ncbi:GNAT family N-acetyltransferase [Streptomyces sp. NPDC018019]|uniref:GNAT family N-acetyltransferase n=1 Tax=Streptomyces sp. NPDC018019 TaxID=3365030 RepID=UPI00379B7E54
MYPVTRHSSRLALRELTTDDVDAVHAIYGDPEVTEHLSFTPRTRDEAGGIVARGIAAATAIPRQEYVLAVVTQGDDGDLGRRREWLSHPPVAPALRRRVGPVLLRSGSGSR